MPDRLIARALDSGFAYAHDAYNGMCASSDGLIDYVLCSERHGLGREGERFVSQGKRHVNFVECDGKLYFGTNTGREGILTLNTDTARKRIEARTWPADPVRSAVEADERSRWMIPHGVQLWTGGPVCTWTANGCVGRKALPMGRRICT